MSTGNNKAFLDVLVVINSMLQLIAQTNVMAMKLMALFEKARSEGRDVSDAELDALRQESLDERDRLLN